MFLSWKGNNSAWIAPVILWSQSSTVASSYMLTSVSLPWSYPWAFWCFAPVLVRAHLLPVCDVWMELDLLLSYWIHCTHDTHLPGKISWCAGQIWLVASSRSLSCLDRGIYWLWYSSPYRWLWWNMNVHWWSKYIYIYVVLVLDGDSDFLLEC